MLPSMLVGMERGRQAACAVGRGPRLGGATCAAERRTLERPKRRNWCASLPLCASPPSWPFKRREEGALILREPRRLLVLRGPALGAGLQAAGGRRGRGGSAATQHTGSP